MQERLRLSQSGRFEEAISLLESSIRNSALVIEEKWRADLAMDAAILSQGIGELQRSHQLCLEALALGKKSPSLYYLLASVCLDIGDRKSARSYFQKCHDQSIAKNETEYLELLERKAEHWK